MGLYKKIILLLITNYLICFKKRKSNFTLSDTMFPVPFKFSFNYYSCIYFTFSFICFSMFYVLMPAVETRVFFIYIQAG